MAAEPGVAKEGNRANDGEEKEDRLVRFFNPEHREDNEQCRNRGSPPEEPEF